MEYAMPDRLFVVVGVTGRVGHRVAERLSSLGHRVRGVARDTSGAGLPSVEMVKADLRNYAATVRALKGATHVYLTPPEEGRDPLLNERTIAENVIHVCREQRVKHLMIHTAIGADSGNTGVKMIDTKTQIERVLAGSGVPYTILRPGWFLQNLLAVKDSLRSGLLELPLRPETPFPTVSADDVASVAVEFLRQGPQNRGFDLHLEKVAPADIGAAAGRILDAPVRVEESERDELLERLVEDSSQRPLLEELFRALRERDLRGKPHEIVDAIPGFRYTDPEAFLRTSLEAPLRSRDERGVVGQAVPIATPSAGYPPLVREPGPLPAPAPEPPPEPPGRP